MRTRFPSADGLVLLTVAIWGVNFAAVKRALAELPPLALNSVRFLAAALVVIVCARALGHRFDFRRDELLRLVGLGLLGNTLYQMLFIVGQAQTTADNGALILSTVPAWVALAGTVSGRDRVSSIGWLGIAASLVGIALIVLGRDASATFRFGGATLRGDLLVLVATLCWSAYTVLIRPLLERHSAIAVTSASLLAGSVPIVAIGLPSLWRVDHGAISLAAWTIAVLSGALAIGASYFCWNIGVARLGAAGTAFYSNLTPAITLATAWLWLGETLTPLQIVGAALAVSGVVLARRSQRPRARS